jgi:pre-mRNA-splicing factor SYF1
MFIEDDDIPFEEDVIRNPFSLKSWLRYIDSKSNSKDWSSVYLIYERALNQIPGSYKLWHNYIKLRRNHIKPKCLTDKDYEEINNIYDRALAYMNKVIDY